MPKGVGYGKKKMMKGKKSMAMKRSGKRAGTVMAKKKKMMGKKKKMYK